MYIHFTIFQIFLPLIIIWKVTGYYFLIYYNFYMLWCATCLAWCCSENLLAQEFQIKVIVFDGGQKSEIKEVIRRKWKDLKVTDIALENGKETKSTRYIVMQRAYRDDWDQDQGKVSSFRTNDSTISLMQHDLSDLGVLILFNLDHLQGLQITAVQLIMKMFGDQK